MRWLLLVGATLAVGTPTAAFGANDYLDQGRIFYEEFEYGQCLVALGHALRESSTPEESVSIQIYSGLCHYHLGELEKAESAFRVALRLDPEARLPPLTSPKLLGFFEGIARTLPADVEKVEQPPATRALQQPVLPPQPRQNLLLPATLAGGAAVGGLVGGAFGLQAKRFESEANAAEYEWDSVQLERRAEQSALIANVAFGVAVTAGLAALTTYLLQAP